MTGSPFAGGCYLQEGTYAFTLRYVAIPNVVESVVEAKVLAGREYYPDVTTDKDGKWLMILVEGNPRK